jgi:peptide/nickel transport system substrate-binding protein
VTLAAGILLASVAATGVAAQTLRTNILADPAMVDPITYSELIAGDVMEGIYEAFTGIDDKGNVIPELAVRWEAHDDNLG